MTGATSILNAEIVAFTRTKTLKTLVQLVEMNGAPEQQIVLQATLILQKIQFPFYYVLLYLSDDQIYPPRYFQIFELFFQKNIVSSTKLGDSGTRVTMGLLWLRRRCGAVEQGSGERLVNILQVDYLWARAHVGSRVLPGSDRFFKRKLGQSSWK
ncbi:hypothetical protein [Phaeodactylibacter xiamenensis]|uniref:hypothetical protein n=1 Tax=Phaeodactylibacter xiamenensis TaxID=1524460 RepID=UPI003CCB9DB9